MNQISKKVPPKKFILYFVNCKQLTHLRQNADYRDQHTFNFAEFKFLVLVARVIAITPNVLLTDQTDIFEYSYIFKPLSTQKIEVNQYYQFVFETKRMGLRVDTQILNCYKVNPNKLTTHWMRIINCEIKRAQKHKKQTEIFQNREQYIVKQLSEKLEKWILTMRQFKVEDINVEFPGYDPQDIDRILKMFQENGLITNFGISYELT